MKNLNLNDLCYNVSFDNKIRLNETIILVIKGVWYYKSGNAIPKYLAPYGVFTSKMKTRQFGLLPPENIILSLCSWIVSYEYLWSMDFDF